MLLLHWRHWLHGQRLLRQRWRIQLRRRRKRRRIRVCDELLHDGRRLRMKKCRVRGRRPNVLL